MHVLIWSMLMALLVVGAGCHKEVAPLANYLAQYQYEAFNPPRDRDGVGSIIDFRDGFESIVVSADPPTGKCLTTANVPRNPPEQVDLLTQQHSVDNGAALELTLPAGVIEGVNLGGAFDDNRVSSIAVTIDSPYVDRMNRDSLLTYFQGLPAQDACRQYLSREGNYIIAQVLGAKGARYKFLTKTGTSIKLDATLLDKVKIGGKWKQQYEGQDELVVTQPRLIGYRLWDIFVTPGLAGGAVGARLLTPQEVSAARAASKGR